MVERFELDFHGLYGEDAYMAEAKNGEFVRYSDYATLEEKLAKAKAAMRTVYDWMNQLPIPTTGCTSKMQLLYDALYALEVTPEPKVTDAMVEVAAKAVVAEWQKMVAETSPHMTPGDHARAFVSPGNYRLIHAALTAALEGDTNVRT